MLVNLFGQSLWRDEAYSAILAKNSLIDIVKITINDTMPPLYHFILHFWIKIFGFSEASLRTPSFIFYLMLIAAVYFFVKEVFKSNRSALFAGVLTAVNPFIFVYAFEARMYTLLMLLSVLSMWFFLTKRWAFYVLVTVLALYTHNFANFIVMCQLLFYLITNGKPSIKNLIKSKFIRVVVVVGILYLPWIPTLFTQAFKVSGDFWIKKPDLYTFFVVLGQFIKGYDHFLGVEVVVIVSVAILIFRGIKRGRDELFYFWMLLIPIVVWIISQVGNSLFLERYLIVSTPAVPILLATSSDNNLINRMLGKFKFGKFKVNGRNIAAIFLIIIILIMANADLYRFNHPQKEPFRELTSYIKENLPKNQVIINYYNDRLHYFELKYYGINTKIYSPIPIPFWNGTALIDKKDVLSKEPDQKNIIVMASQNIGDVRLPGYVLVNKVKFNDLYILWYSKNE